ncbi:hypothetical protein ACVLD2_001679 [Paenibacillus sp. PvR052]|nr:hypothetical protein [Paenibacillus sp. PvP091]MBP1170199.1 hypothetical protein [Paenibacillus sp. PvR098]MBP2441227.1 hypothetical protein [Paenibacillus sp. PvP052]
MTNKIEIDVQKILVSLNLGTRLPYLVVGEPINHLVESDLKSSPPQSLRKS